MGNQHDTFGRRFTGERLALEHLLGGPSAEQQQVLIMTFTPGAMPDEAPRAAARVRLERTFAANRQYAVEPAIAADEADAAVAEAIRCLQPSNRNG